MRCPHCDQEHPGSTEFCPVTGKRLVKAHVCGSCGAKIQEAWKICPHCGKPVGDLLLSNTVSSPDHRTIDHRERKTLLLLILSIFFIVGIAYIVIARPWETQLAPSEVVTEAYTSEGTTIMSGIPIAPSNAKSVIELVRLGKGIVTDFAWSHDGKEIMIATSIGVHRIDSNTMQEKGFVSAPFYVQTIAISPNDQILAMGSRIGEVSLVKIGDGAEIHYYDESNLPVYSLDFSPDGALVASGFYDGSIIIWDVSSGAKIHSFSGSETHLNSVNFSPDGSKLAVGLIDGSIVLWDVASGDLSRQIFGHTFMVWEVAFSPDGKYLASGSGDGTMKVWEIETGREIFSQDGFEGHVSHVVFSPDGDLLLATSRGKLRAWNPRNWNEMQVVTKPDLSWSNALSPDGRRLVARSDYGIVIWDVENSQELYSLPWQDSGTLYDYTDAVISPDGKYLAIAGWTMIAPGISRKAIIHLWEFENEMVIRSIESDQLITTLAFSPDSTILASGSQNGDVRLWDVEDGQEIRTLTGHPERATSLAFSPDGLLLASASTDHTIKVWNADRGQETRTLTGHDDLVSSLAFSPDGSLMASASNDHTIRLWDTISWREEGNLIGHDDAVSDVAFSPDGSLLASSSSDQTIRLWDIAGGQELRTLTGHSFPVGTVAFSEDGALLVSTSFNTIAVWDVNKGKEIHTLLGHTSGVRRASFTPDGSLLVSASFDGTIRIWGIPR